MERKTSDLEAAWRDRKGDHCFEFGPASVQDPALSSRMYGPQLKTVQYRRTIRRKPQLSQKSVEAEKVDTQKELAKAREP